MISSKDNVNRLVNAAFDGMETVAAGTSGGDVLSACFTMALRMIKVSLEKEPDNLPQIRQAIEVLLMECVDTKAKTN